MTNPSGVPRFLAFRSWPPDVLLWGPVVAYMAAIFTLSSMTFAAGLPGGMYDKAAHTLLYSGLGALVVRALARGRWSAVRPLALAAAVLVATLYGVTDEVHQRYVPGREFDLRDIAADAIGSGAAAAALWAWSIIRRFFGPQPGRA